MGEDGPARAPTSEAVPGRASRTVLVVAPTADGRAELAQLLAGRRALRIIAAAPGCALAAQIESIRPDVLVVDLGPTPGRIELDALLRRTLPTGIVALADDARGALGAPSGAGRALLPRRATADQLGAAVEAVLAGLVVTHANALHAVRPPRRRPSAPDEPVALDALTAREIDVLGMMAEGLGNKSIAARLGISAHTVKFHVAAILAKLGASTRTEAVTRGLRRGLIMI